MRLWPPAPPRSLLGRLTLASLCVLPVLLGGAGAILDRAHRDSLLAGEEERLRLHVYMLLGEIDLRDGRPVAPEAFGEPRLNQQASGLYAYLLDDGGIELWRSPSAALQPASPAAPAGRDRKVSANGGAGFGYRPRDGLLSLRYPVIWERERGGDLHFTVLFEREDTQLVAALRAYRHTLWQWLGLLGAALVACQLLVLRWALTPLRQLTLDLAALEGGQSGRLGGDYPREIAPLTTNLNLVLQSEREQRERYRNTLGDLAHSLKTPLAILRGMQDSGALAPAAADPLDRMAAIIDHQLQRATRAMAHRLADAVPVGPAAARLLATLAKVYRDAPRRTALSDPQHIAFRGDERDLMELLGNVLDNAFKYSRSAIRVELSMTSQGIAIAVHDDGPGIPREQRRLIVGRGQRGDTLREGQGIGLAVAADITDAYGGRLAIDTSPLLGGALVQLSFAQAPGPAIRGDSGGGDAPYCADPEHSPSVQRCTPAPSATQTLP